MKHQRLIDIMLLRFLVQAGFSFTVICLCCFMIVTGRADTSESKALYWSGLTSTMSAWLPSPMQPDNKRKRQAAEED